MNLDTSLVKRHRISIKILLIGILILTLQVPIACIEGVIWDRIGTKSDAMSEVSRLAGGAQRINGPVLVIPYIHRWLGTDGKEAKQTLRGFLFPESLKVSGEVATETRYRGVFEIPTYVSDLNFEGSYTLATFNPEGTQATDILWNEAVISVGIQDPRAIRESMVLGWNGQTLEFEPGIALAPWMGEGIHVPVPITPENAKSVHNFNFKIKLGGSSELQVIPTGRETEVKLHSAWKDPSFMGAYLPVERTVDESGFNARWSVSDLGRGFSRVWYGLDEQQNESLSRSSFGVQFLAPVDTHRMSERALKYEFLFIFLTFLSFFLFEVFSNLRIHPIQYLLVGAGLVLFYLLLLSLSEHLLFGAAYLLASVVTIGLVAGYSRSVLKQSKRAGIIATNLAILYSFLYTLLNAQDVALLIGSLGLATILGVVMYLTRNVDWYDVQSSK